MILELKELVAQYGIAPRGVIHIGAHEGQEHQEYQELGFKKVLFIEANPKVYERLLQTVGDTPNVRTVNMAVSDQSGEVTLHVTSYDESSSILPLKRHKELYPLIEETSRLTVPSRTLDELLRELGENPSDYNLLNIDIQGAELLALQGGMGALRHIEAIYTEVNYQEMYEGCALIDQLDAFLGSNGFRRVEESMAFDDAWGDALYLKEPIVTMSTLGENGRFGNQIFQYAFLKTYAKRHGMRVEHSEWVGDTLFGRRDPVVSQPLPQLREYVTSPVNDFIARAPIPYKNVDLWGFFQYHTSYYAPDKDYIRSLFKPTPEIQARLQPGLDKLRSKGKNVVGLHLRRGDYGYGIFFVAPSEWYKAWLKEIWGTLEEPVLFIASDEPEKVLVDFAEYHPVTAQDLGLELPEAPYYPDFWLLSQCDHVAISNSSFSFAPCMFNERAQSFMRPHLPSEKLVSFDPWNAEPLFQDQVSAPDPIDDMSGILSDLGSQLNDMLAQLQTIGIQVPVDPSVLQQLPQPPQS